MPAIKRDKDTPEWSKISTEKLKDVREHMKLPSSVGPEKKKKKPYAPAQGGVRG
jgi:hypothetical protein